MISVHGTETLFTMRFEILGLATCRTAVFVETVSLCPHQMRISAARERECITSYELLYNLCINRHVLELVIRARCDIRVDPYISRWQASERLGIDSSF